MIYSVKLEKSHYNVGPTSSFGITVGESLDCCSDVIEEVHVSTFLISHTSVMITITIILKLEMIMTKAIVVCQ